MAGRHEVDELNELRVLITGGASGIGRSTAQLFAARGAQVAVLDRAAPPDDEFPYVAGDVTDDESVRSAVSDAAAQLGGLDVVVNNAGIGAQGGVDANADEEWRAVFEVNVLGPVRVTRAALAWLRQSGRAAVVNVSSIAATAGLPSRVLYSATKGAVSAMTRAMAADLLPEGIRVNAVNPGTADTPWIGRLLDRAGDPAAERAALEARQPHGRLVSPEEVAAAIAYLAAPSSRSTVGVELAVDGGMAALRLRTQK